MERLLNPRPRTCGASSRQHGDACFHVEPERLNGDACLRVGLGHPSGDARLRVGLEHLRALGKSNDGLRFAVWDTPARHVQSGEVGRWKACDAARLHCLQPQNASCEQHRPPPLRCVWHEALRPRSTSCVWYEELLFLRRWDVWHEVLRPLRKRTALPALPHR